MGFSKVSRVSFVLGLCLALAFVSCYHYTWEKNLSKGRQEDTILDDIQPNNNKESLFEQLDNNNCCNNCSSHKKDEEDARNDLSLGVETNTFFLETSGTGRVSLRQLLAVESAAKHLRDLRRLTVYIVSEKKFQKSDIMLALEARYCAVRFTGVTVKELVQGTPLEKFFESSTVKSSRYVVQHTSDALRLGLLWLKGGLYLDLDIIFQRWTTFPKSTMMLEHGRRLGNALMAFRPKHRFMRRCLQTFVDNYNPAGYSANGPEHVSAVYYERTDWDLELLPTTAFVPFHRPTFSQFFNESLTDKILEEVKDYYGLHYGNYRSMKSNPRVSWNNTSAFSVIASANCPIVWSKVKDVGWV